MDRRSFLATTGAAATTAAAGVAAQSEVAAAGRPGHGSAPAIGGRLRELVLATAPSTPGPVPGSPAERLARRIEAAMDGRWQITLAAVATSGREAIRSGADLYLGCELDQCAEAPALAFFAGLPLVASLAPHELAGWLSVGGGQMLWDDLAGDLGIKAVMCGHTGRSHELWSSRPIERAADLVGAPVLARGLARDVLEAVGAEPVAMAPGEIAAALSAGSLAAAEWAGPTAALALGLDQAAQLRYARGLHPNGIAISLGIARPLWDRLSASEQAIIEACAAEEARIGLAETEVHDAIALSLMMREGAPPQRYLLAEVAGPLAAAAEAVVASAGSSSSQAARIAASYRAFMGLAGTGDGVA